MHANVFHINKNTNATIDVEAAFSFRVFISDIKDRIKKEKTLKAELYKLILERFNNHQELERTLTSQQAVEFTQVLELIYSVLSPPIVDEREYYWALCSPVPGEIIYCTEAFHGFITGYHANKNSIVNQDETTFKTRQEEFFYRMVLEKLYHISSDVTNDVIYTQLNGKKGLEKYFKIHIDTTYVNIKAKHKLPELNPELIEHFLHENVGSEVLSPIIPLNSFAIEGFSIITVEDVTAEHSVEKIRHALVNDSSNPNELFEQVTHLLQTLTGNNNIEFGLLPFLKVNGELVFDTEECFTSMLIKASIKQQVPSETYNTSIERYIRNPRAVFFNEIKKEQEKENFYLKVLRKAGIKSYAILPVYYNRTLTGVIEIYSRKKAIYFEKLLSKLEAALPLLSQLLHNSIEQFNLRIESVIREEFTTLQNSVVWKFNEAAWNYIRDKDSGKERVEIKSVSFKDVYPLYGAIDIRNSTNERNAALRHDLDTMLSQLMETIDQLTAIQKQRRFPAIIKQIKAWKLRINKQITDNDELNIKTFLQLQVYPLFDDLKKQLPNARLPLEAYFKMADEASGEGFARRRALEHSIGLINRALNNYFERAQNKLQKIYPCYFEKFRTDGVEYDIYTGQSLAPQDPFDVGRLEEFRRWQLMSMIDIVNITDKLTAKMDCELRTTQLIFVHPSPIDICFRRDERRFDVEGAYNIRYEVIKKRIDKVLIKGTEERLTQPGKIALVYSNDDEADEFLTYIKELQKSKQLTRDIEYHNLEELQGVTGLKAIRVTVQIKK